MEGEIDNEVFTNVKEEAFIISDEDEYFGRSFSGGHGGGGAVERLRDDAPPPPPFLKKMLEMVDDVETDYIISWSRRGTSFIVWDAQKLCTHLLPKHFKHNNFSSFVRQLNTYGFRKIDPDRWEFANEGFQQGKKHLLKHIKRRNKGSHYHTNNGVEAELTKLRDDQITLRAQVLSLRHQQQDALRRLASVQQRLHVAETKQKHVLVFLIKTLKNPVFMIDKMKRRRGGILKKRRLDEKSFQDDQDLMIEAFPCNEYSASETSHVDVLSENFVLWEKMMEDDMIYEEDVKKQSDIVSELENLIAKTPPKDMMGLVG